MASESRDAAARDVATKLAALRDGPDGLYGSNSPERSDVSNVGSVATKLDAAVAAGIAAAAASKPPGCSMGKSVTRRNRRKNIAGKFGRLANCGPNPPAKLGLSLEDREKRRQRYADASPSERTKMRTAERKDKFVKLKESVTAKLEEIDGDI